MKSILKIKDFGPLKEVDIILKNVNVFIGPQASGKSALAKIFTIFKSPRKFFKEISEIGMDEPHVYPKETIIEILKLFNIDTFITDGTEIFFESEVHKISLKNNEVIYDSKLLNKIKYIKSLFEDFENNRNAISEKIASLFNLFVLFHIRATLYLKDNEFMREDEGFATIQLIKKLDKEQIVDLISILEKIESGLSTNAAIYIPAERIIANIIKDYLANLVINEVPIPKHILSFAAELEKLTTTTIDLGFIQSNLKYKIENGNHRIYINENKSISLEAAASGIQSVIPILSFADKMKSVEHKSFVIEEPELNLFPSAQYRLLELVESIRHDGSMFEGWEDFGIIHTYTTHSPYVLSALNNFLYAYQVINMGNVEPKVKQQDKKSLSIKVNEIVKAAIDPKSFTAYQIKGGFASSIFNEKEGLISNNFIDESTDEINDDFDKLMSLTSE
ncbi:AAA family ATPase [Ferruginibacter sp. HRS2-29]|uniref:AAA family ATPase n=1 Tax=Ferruginibacter sp. HRS2-29 TaxID=2487334 RepID=UPI0020CD22BA|nr:AAA family ATPase [Ferruginibacter sp. HRS2-29]MCP9753193.1 hypothetical protein [Ferruginibacter sp. HRS2-29]